jgi:Lar family restriction alleviation protein
MIEEPPKAEELMPCPFCGGEPLMLHQNLGRFVGTRYGVRCLQCECWCDYREETVRAASIAWNTRFKASTDFP